MRVCACASVEGKSCSTRGNGGFQRLVSDCNSNDQTAFFSFRSVFIDLQTKEVRRFSYFFIEFMIKSSKYNLNILFWFSCVQSCMRSSSSHLVRDASNPNPSRTYHCFFVFSFNKHVSIDFSGNKPYWFYLC